MERSSKRRLARAFALVGACVLLAAACSSASDASTDSSLVSDAASDLGGESNTTRPGAGTGSVDAGSGTGSGTGTGATPDPNPGADTDFDAGAAALAVWPLTGLPVRGDSAPAPGLTPDRPVVLVKIDNHKNARPQFGLNAADLVYEQVVEFGLTRLAAAYHSADVESVGPVRSVRTSDYPLLANLGVPLFANSGGLEGVLAGLNDLAVINLGSHISAGAYWRQPGRRAPNNLMTSTLLLREAAAASSSSLTAVGPSAPLFDFRSAGASSRAAPVSGVDLDFGGTQVSYRWSEDALAWWRTQNGVLHLDTQGLVVAPQNVIVQFVVYGRSEEDARSPEAELLGIGDAWIFTDGGLIRGSWERNAAADSTTFLDLAGNGIQLTPGKTWVALARVGQAEIASEPAS